MNVAREVKFYDVTRELLDQRFDKVQNGGTPEYTDLRHFFYQCRRMFLHEYDEYDEPDSDSNNLYRDWEAIIRRWCQQHADSFNVDEELYWRVREKLNIWPQGKAICDGEVRNRFLIDHESRDRVDKKCSFILLCEKQTVSKELLNGLNDAGYRVNLISTGGQSPSDVQEIVLDIAEELEGKTDNFYFLSLHDYDLAGVQILATLKQRYGGVIDVGVNREFLDSFDHDRRLIEERVRNKQHKRSLRGWMAESDDYEPEDFDYLQGEQVSARRWEGKRIEIDAIHVEYGIEPFIDFILQKIQEECNVWDLTRIGKDRYWEIEEPQNYFEKNIGETKEPVEDIMDETVNIFKDYEGQLYWIRKAIKEHFMEPLKELLGDVEDEIDEIKYSKKDYREDFQDELKDLNHKIEYFEGDVREGIEAIKEDYSELCEKVDEEAKDDPELEEFKEELDAVDLREEEFEELVEKVTREKMKRLTIKALQTEKPWKCKNCGEHYGFSKTHSGKEIYRCPNCGKWGWELDIFEENQSPVERGR